MRVAHVLVSVAARYGGPAVTVVESSLALRALGVETVVLTTDLPGAPTRRRRPPARRVDLPVGAEQLDIRMCETRRMPRLAYAPGLDEALAAELPRCDVVHVHSLFLWPQFIAGRVAREHEVPYVVSPCGALDPHLRRRSRAVKAATEVLWQRRMLARAALLHYKTEEERRQAAKLQLSAPTAVVPNGVDVGKFAALPEPGPFRRRWGLGTDEQVVLFLGRLSHKKGLDVLLEAFARVLDGGRDARLVVAGPDDEERTGGLRARAAQLQIAERVVFTGMLDATEKLAALAAADVWALPSRGENFCVAALEALAAGLPVVLTPAVNLAPALEQSRAAVVAEGTTEAFSTALGLLLDDPDERARLAQSAQAFARRYAWDAVAPKLAEMYALAARGGSARSSPAFTSA